MLFYLLALPSDRYLTRDCFLPIPESITATYEVDENGNAVALIEWNRTRMTNDLDTECIGGQVWKVGVAKYGMDVSGTPEDNMPISPSKYVKWYNVPGENMTFTIPNLNNQTYYIFVVSHRRDVLDGGVPIESATSHVYYFGHQGMIWTPPIT